MGFTINIHTNCKLFFRLSMYKTDNVSFCIKNFEKALEMQMPLLGTHIHWSSALLI
jgi:hypothetical protein